MELVVMQMYYIIKQYVFQELRNGGVVCASGRNYANLAAVKNRLKTPLQQVIEPLIGNLSPVSATRHTLQNQIR